MIVMAKKVHKPAKAAKGSKVAPSESPTRVTFPSNFAELSQLVLDQEKFFSQVVPAFEKARDELVGIVAKDKSLAAKLASTRLVILDNRNTENKMYFWLSNQHDNNQYLVDQHQGLKDFHGFSSPIINVLQCMYGNMYNVLRSLFIEELLARTTPDDLAFHMERELNANYAAVDKIRTPKFFLFRVINYSYSDDLFAMSGYRLNLVVPVADELDASEVFDETWGHKKILLTTKVESVGYKGFDCVVGEGNWHSHFTHLRFSSDLEFFKRLVRLDDAKLYDAVDHLSTTTHIDTFRLKQELLNVPPSDGKRFEACMTKVLTDCFQCSYTYFDFKTQVRNRRNTRIRDYVITNHASTHQFLRQIENKGVELLLFDAKNYREALTPRDITVFKDYLTANKKFGDFGVILARRGVSKNCEDTMFEDFTSNGVIILTLTESDLISMLDKNEQGREAADVLRDKYYEFIKQA